MLNRPEGAPVDKYEAGKSARVRVLGSETVEKLAPAGDAFNKDFQRLVVEYCWGEVWSRSALSDMTRSTINIAILAVMNRASEFKVHVSAALRNGMTVEELRDTLIQVTIYAGIPVGVEAFRLSREVLNDLGIKPDSD
jgi:4-carboxymuconolactone decarboxylase